jgi:N-acetylglucosaminyldiphosphoundecaprenol N-acetyl-beta-D-mannosaminyltransferase
MIKTSTEMPPAKAEAARVLFLGSPVDSLSMDETLARLQEFIQSRSPHLVVAFNVPKLWKMQRDLRLKGIVEGAELILPEQVVTLASRLCGDPLKAYIGNDRLTKSFLPLAAKTGVRLFFLGTRPAHLENMLARLRQQYPGIVIAGSHHGYFTEGEAEQVAAHIRDSQPQVLFVGMGTPRQEYWMEAYGRSTGVPVVIGVGGTLDVLAGIKHDCPAWIRSLGVEWIFRIFEEPRGKLMRYCEALPWFVRALFVKGVLPHWFRARNVAEN